VINEDIATVLGAVIALGLALKAGVGPVVMYLTEAIKDAFQPGAGWGGLISVGVGATLGVGMGILTAAVTEGTNIGVYAAFGAVAGLFMAAGAVETHKAAGQINPEASASVNVERAETVTAESNNAYAAGGASLGPLSFTAFEDSGTYDINRDPYIGTEIPDGEAEDYSGPLPEWHAYREAGGHLGEAQEVDPIPDLPPPSDRYRGTGTNSPVTGFVEDPD
jgi:hypothetical protein